MSSRINVFLTGATGYLGGATLQLLMQKPDIAITALVRNKNKAEKLEKIGIKTVLGSLDDTALMEAEGAKADVVIQGAACDHLDGVNALLKGAKAYFELTGKQPIFIHTSAISVFAMLGAMGEYNSDRVLSDTDPDLHNFKNTLAHGAVNDALIAADGGGYVRTYIVCPSIIYGVLKGPLVHAGIAHAYSVTIVVAVKLSIQRGQGAMVGKGLNSYPVAHIEDTAELYKVLFERALADEAPHGVEGIYAVEHGEMSFVNAAKRYTAVLHARGKSAKAEPEAFTAPEFEKIPVVRTRHSQ
ncbi:NAD(P)-binding protein [Peniophora sp. CONT]|nr:NAD(P)-binding protein [Peniophora sp. CONT]